jgi:membrane dipeptidase
MIRTALSCLALLPIALAAHAAPADADAERAARVHASALVVDTHVDTTQRLLDPHFDLLARHADGGIDLPRAHEGGLDAMFFSIWMPGTVTGAEAVQRALRQIDAVHQQVARHPDALALATTAAEVRAAAASGRVAALIGVEGGHMIADDLDNLRRVYARGARYMTLTHSVNVDWADSSTDQPRNDGLNDFGRDVVREMNRLGMVVDVSHVSDATIEDVLAVSTAPVFASHSSSRALCDVPRNLNDDLIRAIAARGGVVQINYYVGFLSKAFDDAVHADGDRLKNAMEAEVARRCGDDEACQTLTANALYRELVAEGKLPRVEWTEILRHVDHVVKLVGVEHVGLGSDFDGATMPFGMEDASQLPKLSQALLERGYSEADVDKILGGNTLRVLERVERTAQTAGTAAAR